MSDLNRITWALPGEIAVSDYTAACDHEQLSRFGIRAVFCLSERYKLLPAEDLGLEVNFARRINDGPNPQWCFDDCVTVAEHFHNEFGTLLICCKVGRSRSLAVSAALIMRIKQRQGITLTISEALEMVKRNRPGAYVYPTLMPNLRNFVP